MLIYIKTEDCQKDCCKQEMSNSMNSFSEFSVAISVDNEHDVSDCRVVALNAK